MSVLTLVRHGQAQAFEKDSDRLSDTGELQCRALGAYWLRHQSRFDVCIRGSLTRHRQSEEQVRAAGFELPRTAVVDPGWNEYDAGSILEKLGPVLVAQDAGFAARKAEFDAMGKGPDRNRYFQRMFEVLMLAWLEGRVQAEGVEPFADYRDRVTVALRRIIDSDGSNRNVVVFTSGGPIGICAQQVLRAPDSTFLDINWRIRNCAVTEFTFSKGRISLDAFNSMTHLDSDRALWTWR